MTYLHPVATAAVLRCPMNDGHPTSPTIVVRRGTWRNPDLGSTLTMPGHDVDMALDRDLSEVVGDYTRAGWVLDRVVVGVQESMKVDSPPF